MLLLSKLLKLVKEQIERYSFFCFLHTLKNRLHFFMVQIKINKKHTADREAIEKTHRSYAFSYFLREPVSDRIGRADIFNEEFR